MLITGRSVLTAPLTVYFLGSIDPKPKNNSGGGAFGPLTDRERRRRDFDPGGCSTSIQTKFTSQNLLCFSLIYLDLPINGAIDPKIKFERTWNKFLCPFLVTAQSVTQQLEGLVLLIFYPSPSGGVGNGAFRTDRPPLLGTGGLPLPNPNPLPPTILTLRYRSPPMCHPGWSPCFFLPGVLPSHTVPPPPSPRGLSHITKGVWKKGRRGPMRWGWTPLWSASTAPLSPKRLCVTPNFNSWRCL